LGEGILRLIPESMPTKVGTSGGMANRVALTFVFTLSFLSYMTPELSMSAQLAPLALFAGLVFFKVIWSGSVLDAVSSLFEVDGLLFVLFVSLLILAPSFASSSDKSLGFSLAIVICLLLGRLYMVVVPVAEVLEAFFWSGVISISLFLPLTFASFLQSIQTLGRFSAFSFHPNLLAFLLAGYFCVMVWKFMTSTLWMKILSGLLGFVCLAIIFFASSRGSILGIICGCALVVVMSVIRAKKEGRIRLRQVALACGFLLFGFVMFHQSFAWSEDFYSYFDKALAITDSDRGVDSGFTGRFDKWNATLNLLSDGSWMFGRGIRASDSQEQLIDNSYLVMLYEIGLVPLLLITWRFLSISKRFVGCYFQSTERAQQIFYLSSSMLMAVFLVNNVVARFLFSIGNAYSLAALLLFLTPSSRLVPWFGLPRMEPKPVVGSLKQHVQMSS
jgi:O-antigen ligase